MDRETKKVLLAKREEVMKKLLAAGLTYDEARFKVLTAGVDPAAWEEIVKTAEAGSDEAALADLGELSNQARQENKDEKAEAEAELAAELAEIKAKAKSGEPLSNREIRILVEANLAEDFSGGEDYHNNTYRLKF